MTIWKATALLITRLADLVQKIGGRVLPCKHKWADYQSVNEIFHGTVCGRFMVQRCSECGKFRRLKVF
jgi:hypothetical protein